MHVRITIVPRTLHTKILRMTRRHEINKNATQLVWFVNYKPETKKARFSNMQFLDMVTSQNSAGLSTMRLKIDPDNFKSIS